MIAPAKARKLLGRAVVIHTVDPSDDWHHYRLEAVHPKCICCTGMADECGNPHRGDWVIFSYREIASLEAR